MKFLVQKCYTDARVCSICFSHYQKAFANVKHDVLINRPHEIRIDDKNIRIIQLYWRSVWKWQKSQRQRFKLCSHAFIKNTYTRQREKIRMHLIQKLTILKIRKYSYPQVITSHLRKKLNRGIENTKIALDFLDRNMCQTI